MTDFDSFVTETQQFYRAVAVRQQKHPEPSQERPRNSRNPRSLSNSTAFRATACAVCNDSEVAERHFVTVMVTRATLAFPWRTACLKCG
jgi:hypothetical protein